MGLQKRVTRRIFMAKICPIKKEKVLYLECLECDKKADCKDIQIKNATKEIPKSTGKEN